MDRYVAVARGSGKISKHSVACGDITGLLMRFSQLREKAYARAGQTFPLITIQGAGLDVSGSTACW
jgi:transposase